ncbi:MAG TPA: DUF885 domain-containing protein [Kofleriaceae bacterium]|nr:DUF885 domain-containing protein [Kofleriaceae bacterium]
MRARTSLLLGCFLVAACSGSGSKSSAGAPGAAAEPAAGAPGKGAEFIRFVDDYFAARFAFEPTSGTEVGLHEHDGALEDRSRQRIDARVAELEALRSRLAAIDRGALAFDDAIDHEMLTGQIEGELLDLETLRVYEVNPMPYAGLAGRAIDSLIKRDFAPPAQRLRSVIARLKAVPRVFEAARANVKNPPREFTEIAMRRAQGSIGFFEGSVATWAKQAAGGDAALWKEFEEANRAVVDAMREFASWLEKDLLPRSKGHYAIGEAHFLAKLEHEEMVSIPLAELLAKGEAQLEKDYAAFVATARKIDPRKSAAKVMASLSDTHPKEAELIPSVRNSVEEARQYLIDKQIVTVPSEVRARIEETPPYARAGGFASMDTPGPFETKATEAFYYVTPVEKDWTRKHKEEHLRLFNPWVVAMINVHEAYPGHYLQFLYAPRFPTKTRKLAFAASNAEGWAHYAEQMMVDEGFGGGDPKVRLAQLQEALLRDVRYVVGIKLHTAGWTVEQGAKLFVEKAFQEPANGFEESRRGSYNPTYLYYTLGKLQILELREEYRSKKSASLREFHDAFVAQGGLPIALVRKILFREDRSAEK